MQLIKLKNKNKKRQEIVKKYNDIISNINGVSSTFKTIHNDIHPSFHIYAILLKKNVIREKVMEKLKDKGIQTSIHYRPIHTFSAYKTQGSNWELPVTEEISNRILTLPLFPKMADHHLNYICESLREVLKESKKE